MTTTKRKNERRRASPTVVEYVFDLPLKNERELALFVEKTFGVRIPSVACCPHHSSPWQAFCDAYFARSTAMIWEGSRGFAGKSFLVALLTLVEALTLGCDVNLLGGSGEQAKRVIDYQDEFWSFPGAPIEELAGPRLETKTRFQFGNEMTALMASSKSVRGPHVPRLRMDEADEMEMALIDAAQGQPMEKPGVNDVVVREQTLFSSTHHYPDGAMTELKRRARLQNWIVRTWCYKECLTHRFVRWEQDEHGKWILIVDRTKPNPGGWLTPAQVARKRNTVSTAMWDAEYEGQEPSPESRAFAPSAVRKMFDRDVKDYPAGTTGEWMDEGEWAARVEDYFAGGKSKDKNGKEIDVAPGQYAIGADWARKQDWTVFVVLRCDVNPFRVVHVERMQREPWPMMTKRFDELAQEYHASAAHDATGIGDVIDAYLATVADALILTGRTRAELFSAYINAVEREQIVSAFVSWFETEHRTASVDMLFGSGHPPDSVVAGALAFHAAAWAAPTTFS